MSTMQRRELFTSFATRLKKNKAVCLRPPYFQDITLFDTECPSCTQKPCVSLCQEEIIFVNENGSPCLSFEKSGCTYCDKCAQACDNEVLKVEYKKIIEAKVTISTQTCLAWNETICSSCMDICDERAISFFGMFRPMVNIEKCTSCGFCYGVCPTNAVEIKGV